MHRTIAQMQLNLIDLTFDFRQPRADHEPLRVHQPAPPSRRLRRHSRRDHLGHQQISYACSSLLRAAPFDSLMSKSDLQTVLSTQPCISCQNEKYWYMRIAHGAQNRQ